MKITGNTLILRNILESDKQALADAWTGLKYALPNENRQTAFYNSFTERHTNFKADWSVKSRIPFVIHHIADNKPIGYTIWRYTLNKFLEFKFTIITPEYRGVTGLLREFNVLRHKFVYSGPVETTHQRVEKGKAHCLTGLYTNVVDEIDYAMYGTFEQRECSKTEWTNWLNSNTTDKNATYTLEI